MQSISKRRRASRPQGPLVDDPDCEVDASDSRMLTQREQAMHPDLRQAIHNPASFPRPPSGAPRKRLAFFIKVLYHLVNNEEEWAQCISWNSSNDGLIIHDEEKLRSFALPRYGLSSKTASFMRQLNFYGFHKQGIMSRDSAGNVVRLPKIPTEFVHPFFSRNKPQDLYNIVRKTNVTAAAALSQQSAANVAFLDEKQRSAELLASPLRSHSASDHLTRKTIQNQWNFSSPVKRPRPAHPNSVPPSQQQYYCNSPVPFYRSAHPWIDESTYHVHPKPSIPDVRSTWPPESTNVTEASSSAGPNLLANTTISQFKDLIGSMDGSMAQDRFLANTPPPEHSYTKQPPSGMNNRPAPSGFLSKNNDEANNNEVFTMRITPNMNEEDDMQRADPPRPRSRLASACSSVRETNNTPHSIHSTPNPSRISSFGKPMGNFVDGTSSTRRTDNRYTTNMQKFAQTCQVSSPQPVQVEAKVPWRFHSPPTHQTWRNQCPMSAPPGCVDVAQAPFQRYNSELSQAHCNHGQQIPQEASYQSRGNFRLFQADNSIDTRNVADSFSTNRHNPMVYQTSTSEPQSHVYNNSILSSTQESQTPLTYVQTSASNNRYAMSGTNSNSGVLTTKTNPLEQSFELKHLNFGLTTSDLNSPPPSVATFTCSDMDFGLSDALPPPDVVKGNFAGMNNQDLFAMDSLASLSHATDSFDHSNLVQPAQNRITKQTYQQRNKKPLTSSLRAPAIHISINPTGDSGTYRLQSVPTNRQQCDQGWPPFAVASPSHSNPTIFDMAHQTSLESFA